MRKLIVSDVPKFCRIIKRLEVREDIKRIAAQADRMSDIGSLAADIWGAGFDMIWTLMEKASAAAVEADVYAFLAGPFECEADVVASMPLPEFKEKIVEFVKGNDLRSFFGCAEAMMK